MARETAAQLVISGDSIDYTLRRSSRARRVSLSVSSRGELTATIPELAGTRLAETFIREKIRWILKNQSHAERSSRATLPSDHASYQRHKEAARAMVRARLSHFNKQYQFAVGGVRIKNTSSLWGSCSSKRNLNFNYRLVLLPQVLADYVIVHELCHLAELNHSPRFWRLVATVLPQYRQYEKQLGLYRL
jgi:predicted metal-dependent hydrolase